MGNCIWGLAAKLYFILIKLKIVSEFQTVTICVQILVKFDGNVNLLELVIIGVFERATVGLESLGIEHGRFNKIFNCKFNGFTTLFDINFEIKPLEMIFGV